MNKIGDGIASGDTIDILGNYSFYGATISQGSSFTYSAPNLTAKSTDYTVVDTITVNGTAAEVKVIGSVNALTNDALKHIPNSATAIVSTDLYLPTSIPSQNAVITWTSSNENLIDNSGTITADQADRNSVTLYAEIKVNGTVYTQSFTFLISAHSNEINFYKLVQEISPLVIYNVYNESNANQALYHLPIVTSYSNGEYGDYDYRTSYNSPSDDYAFYVWNAYRELRLQSLVYSLDTDQYGYITLQNNNELYLNKTTLNTYAQLTITGTFENGEQYESYVNISISVGSNTQLLESAFNEIEEDIHNVDVLYNILSTRLEDGILNEKGDFTLMGSITLENAVYTYTYAIPSASRNIITRIDHNSDNTYTIILNPEYFTTVESSVGLSVTATYGSLTKTKTIYFKVPAVVKTEDFGTISVFNSVKYQAIQQLPANEIASNTGFSGTTTITNTTADYLLIRDIVGDETYCSEYGNTGNYITLLGETFVQAEGTKDLYFYTQQSNNSSATDNVADNFIRLVEWATSNKKVTASSVVSALSTINSTVADYYSNGKDYITDHELAVLKAYYEYYTGQDWDDIASKVLETKGGYVFDNPTLITTILGMLYNAYPDNSNWTDGGYGTEYNKYIQLLNDWAMTTTSSNQAAGNHGSYGRYNWTFETSAPSSYSYYTQDKNGTYWVRPTSSVSSKDSEGGFISIFRQNYKNDGTEYITIYEFRVLVVFWLDVSYTKTNDTFATTTDFTNLLATSYPDYSTSDFSTVGQAIINGFTGSLTIPTYFTGDGLATLIQSFYDNCSSISSSSSFVTSGVQANSSISTDLAPRLTSNNITARTYYVPTITNLDVIGSGLSYFEKLENLYIYGNSNLNTFLHTTTLEQFYSRMTSNNSEIVTLVMEYNANNYVTFDVTNIKKLSKLKIIDLANNGGFTNTNVLANINKNNYKYVDIRNIGVTYKYAKFAIDNLASSTCIVFYSDGASSQSSTSNANANSALTYLAELEDLIGNNMYLTNSVIDETGTTAIYWRLENGKGITSVTYGGTYPEIESVSEMNEYISPYYYCGSQFTFNGYTFRQGYVYKYTCDSTGAITITEIMEVDGVVNDIDDIDSSINLDNIDYTEIESEEKYEYKSSTDTSTAVEQTYITDAGTTITLTINRITIGYYYSRDTNYYWYVTDGYLRGSTSVNTTSGYFALLTADQAQTLENPTQNATIGAISPSATTAYYIYNLSTGAYVGTSGAKSGNIEATATTYTDACQWTYYKYSTRYSRYSFKTGNYYVTTSDTNYVYGTSTGNTVRINSISSSNTSQKNTTIYNSYIKITYNSGEETTISNVTSFKTQFYSSSVISYLATKTDYVDVGEEYYYLYTGSDSVFKHNTLLYVFFDSMYRTYTQNINVTTTGLYYVYQYIENGTINTVSLNAIEKGITSVYYSGSTSGTINTSTYVTQPTLTADPNAWSDSTSWELAVDKYAYISYVTTCANNTNISARKALIDILVNNGRINYLYTGTSGNETLYKESTSGTTSNTYTKNYLYVLNKTNNGLVWESDISTSQVTSSTTLDSILAEANTHYNDSSYGTYYGNYYAYSGDTITTTLGNYYIKGHVYQLISNSTNTAFAWYDYGQYYDITLEVALVNLGIGGYSEGTIIYVNDNTYFTWYTTGWYKVVLNSDTQALDLVKIQDVSLTHGTSRDTITNEKYVQKHTAQDQLGYSGVFEVEISAVVKVSDGNGGYTEYIKTYKILVYGDLY